ncbi:MAG: HPr(Ser) kinase/phosphatase [Acidobacteriota bacterium]
MEPSGSTESSRISVAELITTAPAEFDPEVLGGGEHVGSRFVESERIQKLGLALTGFTDYLRQGRIKIVGMSEISYLSKLGESRQSAVFEKIDAELIPCLLVTKALDVPASLCNFAADNGVPLLKTGLPSSRAIGLITDFLQERLAPHTTIHGVLMEISRLGVLLLGESGIGKSECALDLLSRGHALISDDSVFIKKIGKRLIGDSVELTRGHLEIRGLGIINTSELFGISSVGKKAQIDLAIELRAWNDVKNVDRLGLEVKTQEIFGVKIPSFVLPVSPARNLAILVETAVRVFMLKRSGSDTLNQLIQKHNSMVAGGSLS